MTQKTAFSPFMLNGKQLTIKDAEAIASEAMEHAIRRNLKCKWGRCGINYGSIHLLGCVSGLEEYLALRLIGGLQHIRQEHISKMIGAQLGPSMAGTVCKYHSPPFNLLF